MIGYNRTLLPTLAAALLSGSCLFSAADAVAPQQHLVNSQHPQFNQQVGALPDSVDLRGAEVESIKNVESISDWQTLDTKHLTLKINNAQRYLLTLEDQCMHLRGARMVGVSMTNQEIWADFDHVAADGWECRIDTITRLGRNRS